MDAIASVSVSLLGDFGVQIDGSRASLPAAARRLVAFCALQPTPLPRVSVAGQLWPDGSDTAATARLRGALWQVRELSGALLDSNRRTVCLHKHVTVDLHGSRVALTLDSDEPERAPPRAASVALIAALQLDLLPSWDEEWLPAERERWRQQRLHGLEQLAWRLGAAGRTREAVDLALCAIAADPSRESAHRVLVRLHLSEGNRAEALRQAERFRQVMRDLGLEPTPAFGLLAAEARSID